MPRKTWRAALAAYASPSTLVLLLLGFAAGLPYMLVFSTLSVWLREAGVAREAEAVDRELEAVVRGPAPRERDPERGGTGSARDDRTEHQSDHCAGERRASSDERRHP